ncbi:ABC-type transport auxiliary lipoprotein family protein [Thiohalobacter sp.]|uniref:ABC-type transport auxiliary lipoprotein family protein n=1 Tax=Thiohalobacter sp. TaxID=2025948 RepID=UPI00261BF2CE|nr:ABC-type transport auxiliary lipoprotein family protein [Thiohalobacter sp.]
MKRVRQGSLLLLVCAWLLTACGGGAVAPETRYYRLDPELPAADPALAALPAVVVERFTASPLYRGRELVHGEADRPLALVRHHYHYWHEAPPLMLARAQVHWLRAAGLEARLAGEGAPARYRVQGHIAALDQIYDGAQARAHLHLQLRLVDSRSDRVLARADYDRWSSPVPARAYDTVAAFRSLLAEIHADWQRRLAEALARMPRADLETSISGLHFEEAGNGPISWRLDPWSKQGMTAPVWCRWRIAGTGWPVWARAAPTRNGF